MNSYFKRAASSLPVAMALVLGLALPGSSQRAADSIHVGGQAFQVGMSKDEAMSRLALCCKLSGQDDSFEIMSKGSPFQTYGGIRFAKDEVVSVTRDVGQFQEGASVKLAQALYRELSEMSTANGHTVILRTSETEGTDVTIRYVTLSFPNGRSIAIEINKVDSVPNMTDWVDVKEYLEKP